MTSAPAVAIRAVGNVSLSAAKDRTFKTVRPNQGTVCGARDKATRLSRSRIVYRAQFRSGGWRVNGQEVALVEERWQSSSAQMRCGRSSAC